MEKADQPKITIDELGRMMANGFAEMRDQFATLENYIRDLDAGNVRILGRRLDVRYIKSNCACTTFQIRNLSKWRSPKLNHSRQRSSYCSQASREGKQH